jgi:predicted porin
MAMDVMYGRIDFEPTNTFAWRTSTSDQITAGFKGQLNAVWSTEIRLGWRETEYDAYEGEQVVDNFSGVIIDGDLTWDLAHGSSLRLDLLRSDFPSNFSINAYYTATRGILTYSLDRGKFFGLLRGRYQNNDYALPDLTTGTDRSDDITSFNLGIGYRFTNLFSLYGSYLYEDRSSNINRFGYTTNIYTIGLTIGY